MSGGARATRRLFFALWPDAAMRAQLARAVDRTMRAGIGQPVPTANLHLTLAFLGAVPDARLADLSRIAHAAGGIAERGRWLHIPLERLEYWPRPRVLCAVPTRPQVVLGAWVGNLLASLSAEGFSPDLKLFRPHVTVARKVTRPSAATAMPAVHWRFDRFMLVQSCAAGTGPLYSVVAAYPLFSGALTTK